MTSIKCCGETGSVSVCVSSRLSNVHTGSPDVVRSWAQTSPLLRSASLVCSGCGT